MARTFDDASSQYLQYSGAIVSSYPVTMALWFYSNDASVYQMAFSQCLSTDDGSEMTLEVRNSGNGQTIAAKSGVVGFGGRAISTTSWSTNTWHHHCGVFSGEDARAVYLDGGSKGTDSTSGGGTPSLNRTTIGGKVDLTPTLYFSGSLAEVAMWNVALTDAEAAILALGYSPLMVRPASLVAYWPLIGRLSPEIDTVGGFDMTLNNSPTTAAHPRVIYPAPPILGGDLTAAATVDKYEGFNRTMQPGYNQAVASRMNI